MLYIHPSLDANVLETKWESRKGGAEGKIKALEEAGVTITKSPAKLGATLLEVMQRKK